MIRREYRFRARWRNLAPGLAALSLASVLGGVSSGALANNDPLFDTISARLDSAPVVVSEFTQTRRIAGLKQAVVSRGRLIFARGQGLVWQIEQPHRHTYVLGAQGMAQIDAQGQRRFRSTTEGGTPPGARMFDALLRGDLGSLSEHFAVVTGGHGESWTVHLRPRRSELAGVVEQLVIKGGREVSEITVVQTGGDSTHITLRNTRRGESLTPAQAQLFGP